MMERLDTDARPGIYNSLEKRDNIMKPVALIYQSTILHDGNTNDAEILESARRIGQVSPAQLLDVYESVAAAAFSPSPSNRQTVCRRR